MYFIALFKVDSSVFYINYYRVYGIKNVVLNSFLSLSGLYWLNSLECGLF